MDFDAFSQVEKRTQCGVGHNSLSRLLQLRSLWAKDFGPKCIEVSAGVDGGPSVC